MLSRKIIGRVTAVFALTAGLVILAAQTSSADHTSTLPVQPAVEVTASNTAQPEDGAVDLNNLMETRVTLGQGSKFRPRP